MKLPMASGLEDDELGVEVDDGVVVLWRRLPVASAPREDRVAKIGKLISFALSEERE